MPVGDVNSNVIGSGARYNDGKVPLDLLDIHTLYLAKAIDDGQVLNRDPLWYLAKWYDGGGESSLIRASQVVSMNAKFWPDGKVGKLSFGHIAWDECARVFEYGAKKYSANNWRKGMVWSIPLGCMLRHLQHLEAGELIDDESGLTHIGHLLCNATMLVSYASVYPEGDDRPKILRRVTCNTPTSADDAITSSFAAGKTESVTPML